jgi:hypothetical protein
MVNQPNQFLAVRKRIMTYEEFMKELEWQIICAAFKHAERIANERKAQNV